MLPTLSVFIFTVLVSRDAFPKNVTVAFSTVMFPKKPLLTSVKESDLGCNVSTPCLANSSVCCSIVSVNRLISKKEIFPEHVVLSAQVLKLSKDVKMLSFNLV